MTRSLATFALFAGLTACAHSHSEAASHAAEAARPSSARRAVAARAASDPARHPAPPGAAAPPVAVAESRPTPGSPASPRFVAWTEAGEEVVTHWVEATAEGHRVVEQRPGRWVEVDGSEWEVRVEPVALSLPSCRDLLQGTWRDARRAGHGQRVALVRTLPDGTGAREERVVLTEPRTDGTSVESSVTELSLIGDLVLVETATWMDPCGAFADEVHETVAFRLSTWERADLDVARRGAAPAVLRSARTLLGALEEPSHLSIGAVRPRVRDGRLVADYVVTVTPSSEDLEPWSANVGAVTITSDTLPNAWGVDARIPPGVASYADTLGRARLVGYAATTTVFAQEA